MSLPKNKIWTLPFTPMYVTTKYWFIFWLIQLIIFAVLHCKLQRVPNSGEGNQERYAARILDILSSERSGKKERDLWHAFFMQSKGDLRDLIFMKPLHIRIRITSLDHPKDNKHREILTDSSIKVNVLLNWQEV